MFKQNIKSFDWKKFITLIFISLIPTIYTTIRIYFLGEFDDPYTYSIAAQISWLNVFFEIVSEAIIIPLFFLISKRKNNESMLFNRIKTGFFLNLFIYFIVTIALISTLQPILNYLIQDEVLKDKSRDYIFLELIASFFSSIFKYVLVIWIVLNKNTKIIFSFLVQMIFIILFDTFFISKLNISLNLSIIGIALSNILTNIILVGLSVFFLYQMKVKIWIIKDLNFKWMIQYWKIGIGSGLESLIRNLFFTFMVLKILNDVNGSGDYWVANGFIWSWLLLPVMALGTTIKAEGDANKEVIKSKLWVYLLIVTGIIVIWLVTIPSYGLFIRDVLNVTNYQYIFKIVMILFPFYILFAINSVFDGVLIGWGRTDLLLYQSIFANVSIYLPYFIALKTGAWIPSVEGVAIMFGIGMTVDSILTIIMFVIIVKFDKKLILTFEKKNIKRKTFVFGMPTVGKTTFVQNNPNTTWDSDNLYHYVSSVNQDSYNTFDIDHKFSKKLLATTNKKLLKSNFDIIFYSVLPIELYEEIDWLIYKNVNIVFINRTGEDYQYEWCKRKEKVNNDVCDLNIENALLTSKFINKQAEFFKVKLVNLEKEKYISEETLI